MKRIINILLVVLLSLCVFGCSSSSNDTPAGNDVPKEDEVKKEEWLCNKQTFYNGNGEIESYTIYTYNKDGKFLSYEEYDGNSELKGKAESAYDEKGREIENVIYDGNGEIYIRSEFEYNDKDQMIKETDYDAEGEITAYFTYEYDSNGNNIHSENTTADGFLSMTSDKEYNDHNKLIKNHRIFYGHSEWTIVYEYSNDILDRSTEYNADGSISRIAVYKYSDQNSELYDSIEYYSADNNLTGRQEFRYDENENRISYAYFDAEGNMNSMTEYEYIKK